MIDLKVSLTKFLTIAQCWLTTNIQRFLCTVIKFQSSSSSAFITNFNLFEIMPFLYSNDNTGSFNLPFHGRNIQCRMHCQFSPVSA